VNRILNWMSASLADSADKLPACRLRFGSLAGCPPSQAGSLTSLQHITPFVLVFEHDLAQETNGWHAVIEQLVMEFL
jgi:hypothetical protein